MRVPDTHITLSNGKEIHLFTPLAKDALQVLEYVRTLFHESSKNLNFPATHFDSLTVAEEAALLSEFEKSDSSLMICALRGGKILGNVSLRREGGEFAHRSATLGIGVIQEAQGQGLGKALLLHCISEAKRLGFLHLNLRVRTFNHTAIGLYESCGFEKVGLLKSVVVLPTGPTDELLYQKII